MIPRITLKAYYRLPENTEPARAFRDEFIDRLSTLNETRIYDLSEIVRRWFASEKKSLLSWATVRVQLSQIGATAGRLSLTFEVTSGNAAYSKWFEAWEKAAREKLAGEVATYLQSIPVSVWGKVGKVRPDKVEMLYTDGMQIIESTISTTQDAASGAAGWLSEKFVWPLAIVGGVAALIIFTPKGDR